jgi:hypothetical protein
MGYVTAADVAMYLKGVTLTALGDAAAISAAELAAGDIASLEIESRTGRTFTQSAAEERIFDGNGGETLMLTDFDTTPTAWKIDDQAQAVTELLAYPLNETPKTRLVRKEGGTFPLGNANLKITAKWGYGATVPVDVKAACAMLAAAEILDRVSGALTTGSESVTQGLLRQTYPGGAFSGEIVRYRQRAYWLVESYRRLS